MPRNPIIWAPVFKRTPRPPAPAVPPTVPAEILERGRVRRSSVFLELPWPNELQVDDQIEIPPPDRRR